MELYQRLRYDTLVDVCYLPELLDLWHEGRHQETVRLALARGLLPHQVYTVKSRWGSIAHSRSVEHRRYFVFTGDLVRAIESIGGDDSERWSRYLLDIGRKRDGDEWRRARGLRFKPVEQGGKPERRGPRGSRRKDAGVNRRELLPVDAPGDAGG